VISKATRVWLDGVAEGNDHAALCACQVFAALESGDGVISARAKDWLVNRMMQRGYQMVRKYAANVVEELEALRSEK
jgi:hypothetical protein